MGIYQPSSEGRFLQGWECLKDDAKRIKSLSADMIEDGAALGQG